MKGPNIEEEIKNATKALKILGGKIEKIDKVWIGQENMQRNIIVIKKIEETPKGFPRQPGKAAKEPII
jgi:16S rRNA (guanine527-N7)-methyltransferase